MSIQIRQTELFVRNLHTRMPFRYGIATLTRVPHIVLRLTAEVDGSIVIGHAADHLIPKWFTKDPATPFAEDVEDMLGVIDNACAVAASLPPAPTPFDLWDELYRAQGAWAERLRYPPLLWNFGVSLVERAAIEAFCRSAGLTFSQALYGDRLGMRLSRFDPQWNDNASPAAVLDRREPLSTVRLRHTVGLSDPLTDSEIPPGERADDGLPQSLESCLAAYRLTHLKIKLAGDTAVDAARLRAISRLASTARGSLPDALQFTLDGNENYKAVEPFRALWDELQGDPALREFLGGLIFVEQPLHREVALSPETAAAFARWPERPPIIIDESDACVGALRSALDVGYAGTSHKNCKGIFKGVGNACILGERARGGEVSILSSEDLCNIGPIALLQDLAVVAALGIPHSERNGHHYFAGLSQFPASIQRGILEDHPDLYAAHADGFPIVRVEDGAVATRSVSTAAFGVAAEIDLSEFIPLDDWTFASLESQPLV